MPSLARNAFLVLVVAVAPAARAAPTAEEIARAVRELGDDSFEVRRRASAFLWKAGEAAEPALVRALASKDPEVVRRAREILDKFSWGIYPETPADIVKLVGEYRSEDPQVQKAALLKLLARGQPGYAVVRKLAARKMTGDVRRALFQWVSEEMTRSVPRLLVEGRFKPVEQLLEMNLASRNEHALRSFAVFGLLRGRLDDVIPLYKDRARLPGEAGAAADEVLVYLCRAKGDPDGAIRAAVRAKQADALEWLLVDRGRWADLAGRKVKDPLNEIRARGREAAYLRRAGRVKEFDRAVAEIVKAAGARRAGADGRWEAARVLLLGERPREALDLLVGPDGNRARAWELLTARENFREATALIEREKATGGRDLFALRLLQAGGLCDRGEPDQAIKQFAELAREVKGSQDVYRVASVIGAEDRHGLRDQALAHCGEFLGLLGEGGRPVELLGAAFPRQADAADLWWAVLRKKFPREDAAATVKRLRRLVEGRKADDEFDSLAREAEKMAGGREGEELDKWLASLAAAEQARGRDGRARRLLERAVKETGSAAARVRLGDFLAGKKLWKEAAASYLLAWEADRTDALPLYLRGRALARGGGEKEGRALVEAAHLLPLGNERDRYTFMEQLAARGHHRDALREADLLSRTAGLDSPFRVNARNRLARDAADRKDFLQAAAYQESAMLRSLGDVQFTDAASYMMVPYRVHRYRARGLLAAGKVEGALDEARACLALLPADWDIVQILVPELDRRRRRADADRLFDPVFRLREQLCKDFPKSGRCHYELARLAAVCRRRLDPALAHARKAVELQPRRAKYLDTLAEVHFQRGDKDAALKWNRRCLEVEPDSDYLRKQRRRFEAGDPAAPLPE